MGHRVWGWGCRVGFQVLGLGVHSRLCGGWGAGLRLEASAFAFERWLLEGAGDLVSRL